MDGLLVAFSNFKIRTLLLLTLPHGKGINPTEMHIELDIAAITKPWKFRVF